MSQRTVPGSPVNLKERIAALQQRAASTSPQQTTSLSNSSSFTTSPTNAATTGSALRDRIAKFEKKGGVPVPRGSFGLGAPPPAPFQTREGCAARRKGELYGNRIASASRGAPLSPPSSFGNLGVGPNGAHLSGPGEENTGSPVRKRCISTSVLEDSNPSLTLLSSTSTSTVDESEGDAEDASLPVKRLFAVSDTQAGLTRRNSVSGADAMQSSRCKSPSFVLENASTSTQALETPTLQDVPDVLPSRSDDEVHGNLSKSASVLPEEASVGPISSHTTAMPPEETGNKAEEKRQVQEVMLDAGLEEDSAKTPVVSSSAASCSALPCPSNEPPSLDTRELAVDYPNDDAELSDVTTPSTGSPSPFTASLEMGERAFHETQTFVVMPPSGAPDTSIASVLEKLDDSQNSGDVQNDIALPEPVVQAEVSAQNDEVSTTKDVPSADSEANGSYRRRQVPSPISIISDEQYVEPPLKLTTGSKSFHAIVHTKKTQVPTVSLPRTAPRSTLGSQVVTVRQGAVERLEPATPGSPDLSALVAQALHLEQQLMGGEYEAPSIAVPPPVQTSEADLSATGASPDSSTDTNVRFPRSSSVHAALGNVPDIVPPMPSPKSPQPHARAQTGQNVRTSWSCSSEQASSEDSVPVLTPPSPTFDLVTPPLCEDSTGHAYVPARALSVVSHEEDECRRSIGSILSSPGRSARKKVLSMSRSSMVFGRMLSRAGRSSSTLALPDDAASTHTWDSVSDASARPPSPSQNSAPYTPLSLSLPLHDTLEDVPNTQAQARNLSPCPSQNTLASRPHSVLSTSTTSALSSNSPLDRELFDAFPPVPNGPGHGHGLRLRLGQAPAQDSGMHSPPPPPPPSKSPVLLGYMSSPPSYSPPLPQQAPPPPSPESKPTFGKSMSSKPNSKPPLPPHIALSNESYSSDAHPHSSTTSSIFSAISRSLSGRTKARLGGKQQASALDAPSWYDDVAARNAA